MSILLFLNDKCFYFPILLKLGRISRDIYINFFNKKIEMVPIHAPDIADLHCFFYNCYQNNYLYLVIQFDFMYVSRDLQRCYK